MSGTARLSVGLFLGCLLALQVPDIATLRADDPVYFVRLPDLPLMPGMTEVEEAGLVFDKPDGRIVEAYADGQVSQPSVQEFYRQTLPQLGWRIAGPDAFSREGERLRLEFLESTASLTLRFVLTPQ